MLFRSVARAAQERGALETRSASLKAQLAEGAGLAAAARAAADQWEEQVQSRAALQIEIESEIARDEESKRSLRTREGELDIALRPIERDLQSIEFERERFVEELGGDLAAFGRRLADDPRLAAGIPDDLRHRPTEESSEAPAASDEGETAARERFARQQAISLVAHWEMNHAADAPLPEAGKAIPKDDKHLHFGKGQTETTFELKPGKHTLQLLLGDFAHVPHNPPVQSEVVTITVE